jgi:phosphosulfolactate synthase (CoM biosynthesis protein A)
MAAKLAPLGVSNAALWDAIRRSRGELYEARHRQREINSLKRKATNLGFQIIEASAA